MFEKKIIKSVTNQSLRDLLNRKRLNKAILHIDQLLKQCQRGEHSAQMEVYRRYYKAMFNTSLRIVKDRFSAEDIMQESFLIAFDKLDDFKGAVSFGSWLKKIVINNSLKEYNKSSRYAEVLKSQDYFDGQHNHRDDSEIIQLKAEEIVFALSRLKDRDRIILSLFLIEGYDYEEISEIMLLSNTNCRTLVSRAKQKLRNEILTI